MTEQPPRSCIFVELTDGTLQAFNYPDPESAEKSYRECREEWNAGRNVIFYLRRTRYGRPSALYYGDEVAHLELTTREDAAKRGADCQDAVVFG